MLHHAGTAFCHMYMMAEFENKFLARTKTDPAFSNTGFTSWKEAITAFKKHTNSACHLHVTETVKILSRRVQDIDKLLDASTQNENDLHRPMFKCTSCELCVS